MKGARLPTAIRKRAVNDEQKNHRRSELLTAARRLYMEQSFESVSIDAVAKASGVAKGTVYLYFKTKEALFLALYDQVALDWFERLYTQLELLPSPCDIQDFARTITQTLQEVPLMAKLNAILNTTLETKVDTETLLISKRRLISMFKKMAPILMAKLELADASDVREVIQLIYVLITGAYHLSTPNPKTIHVYKLPEMATFRVEFKEIFEKNLVYALLGMKRRP